MLSGLTFIDIVDLIYIISGLFISSALLALFAYNRRQVVKKSSTFHCDIRMTNDMAIYYPAQELFIVAGPYINDELGTYSGKVAIYDKKGKCLRQLELECRQTTPETIKLLTNRTIIISGWFWDGQARLWDINTGEVKIIQKLPGPYHYQMNSICQDTHNSFLAIQNRFINRYGLNGENIEPITVLEESEGSKFIGFANRQILIIQLNLDYRINHNDNYELVGITTGDPTKEYYCSFENDGDGAIAILSPTKVAWISSNPMQKIHIYDFIERKTILSFPCIRMGLQQSDYLGVFKEKIVTFDKETINIWSPDTGRHLQSILLKHSISGIAISQNTIITTSYRSDDKATIYS